MKGTALIGRDVELGELARAVTRNRVVSLTGAPGVGKSALAQAFAESRASVFCSLAGVTTVDAVCSELARALGVPSGLPTTPRDAAARVGRALATRGKLLVVLDEATVARGPLTKVVPVWLVDAPSVRFLVAARVRVNVAGAQRFDVGPLEVPEPAVRDLETISKAAAVRFFVRCATAVRPEYRLTAEAAPFVASIVRTLTGLPLAIELCASRVVVLGERELSEILAERLDALDAASEAKGGRTLRGAFALSWDQLSTFDARILAACAVFRGSFDLDGASALTGEPRLRAAEALERLEEASLVEAFEPTAVPGSRRYVVRASVRAFAQERLDPASLARASLKHAEHHGARASRTTVPQLEALALARDDLEAALVWATAEGHFELAAPVAVSLAPLALARGPLMPFLARIDALLDEPRVPRALTAELHLVRGLVHLYRGRRDEALADLVLARKLARRVDDLTIEVRASSKIGLIQGLKGDLRAARTTFSAIAERVDDRAEAALRGGLSKDLANVLSEEGKNAEAIIELAHARDLFHAAGDLREEGFTLMMLGSRLADSGQLEDARRDLGAGLRLLEQQGDQRSICWCQVLLAVVDSEQGDLGAARTRLDGALASLRAIGDVHTEGLVLGYLGNVALEQGALADAEAMYRDARGRLAEARDKGSEGLFTAAAGLVDVALGRAASARERFERARVLTERDGRAARREAMAIFESVLDEPTDEPAHGGASEDGEDTAEEVRFARRAVLLTRERLGTKRTRVAAASIPPSALEGAEQDAFVIAPDGSWVKTPGGQVARFGANGALRGIVRLLAQDRVRYPGRPISLPVLVRAGWPDETILPAAAKNRLHVTIARLRRAGLAELLKYDDDGYLLDPQIDARFAEAGERPPAVG